MKKYCKWKDEEVKKLFCHVEQCTQGGKTLSEAFASYALISGRKPNSVRNYYYAELSALEQDSAKQKALGIDLKKHPKTVPNFFSAQETEQCMNQINQLVEKGYSVRKACLTLAGGDVAKMVRLQNKYRTMQKKQQPQQLPTNIISMPQKTMRLTDAEINSLFLGLVKLIKTSAKQELGLAIKKETENANAALRQALVNISNKEQQYARLKKSFDLLKAENQKLDEKLKQLRSEQVANQKMNALATYAKKMAKSSTKKQTSKNNG